MSQLQRFCCGPNNDNCGCNQHSNQYPYLSACECNNSERIGLGSASSNAASVIRILEKLNYVDLKKKNFSAVGADVPFFINNKDSLIREIGNITINQSFPKYFFFLIIYSYKSFSFSSYFI